MVYRIWAKKRLNLSRELEDPYTEWYPLLYRTACLSAAAAKCDELERDHPDNIYRLLEEGNDPRSSNPDREAIRMHLWSQVAIEVSGKNKAHFADDVNKWADKVLKGFDKTFPE